MLSEEVKEIIILIATYADTLEWTLIKRELRYLLPKRYRTKFSLNRGTIRTNNFEDEIIAFYKEISGGKELLVRPLKGKSHVYELTEEEVKNIKERLNRTENWHNIARLFCITVYELHKIYSGKLFSHIKIDQSTNKRYFIPPSKPSPPENPMVFEGQDHPNAKLTNSDVIEIKRRLVNGDMPKQIAQDYNMSQTLIEGIKYGKKWKCIPWPSVD